MIDNGETWFSCFWLSKQPGKRSLMMRLNDLILASGLSGCLTKISCLPLLSSIFAILRREFNRSGLFCSVSAALPEGCLLLVFTWLLETGWMDNFLILVAANLPLRELWERVNSTSSPCFNSFTDVSIRSLTWKKTFFVSLLFEPFKYSIKPHLKFNFLLINLF